MVGIYTSVWVRKALLPHIRGVQATCTRQRTANTRAVCNILTLGTTGCVTGRTCVVGEQRRQHRPEGEREVAVHAPALDRLLQVPVGSNAQPLQSGAGAGAEVVTPG